MQHKVENVKVQSTQLRRLHIAHVDTINSHKYISFLDLCTRSRVHTEAGGRKNVTPVRVAASAIFGPCLISNEQLCVHTQTWPCKSNAAPKGISSSTTISEEPSAQICKAGVSVRVRGASLELRNSKQQVSIGSGLRKPTRVFLEEKHNANSGRTLGGTVRLHAVSSRFRTAESAVKRVQGPIQIAASKGSIPDQCGRAGGW